MGMIFIKLLRGEAQKIVDHVTHVSVAHAAPHPTGLPSLRFDKYILLG